MHNLRFGVGSKNAASRTGQRRCRSYCCARDTSPLVLRGEDWGAPVPRSRSHTPRAYPGRGTQAEGPLWPAHDPRRRGDQETQREARERAAPGRRSTGRSASPGLPRAPAPRIRRRHRMFFRSGPPPPAPALTFSPLPSSTPAAPHAGTLFNPFPPAPRARSEPGVPRKAHYCAQPSCPYYVKDGGCSGLPGTGLQFPDSR